MTKNSNNQKQAMYRQGDVLFIKIEALPTEPLTERKSPIIVEGEVTGHAHRLLSGRILETAQQMLYLDILAHTQVVHEEHKPIDLEPGYYQIVRQREYVAPELSRMVVD